MASTWGENDEVVVSETEEVKVQSTWGENDEVVETEEKSDPNNMWAIALRTALSSVPGFGDIGIRKPNFDPEASEGLPQEMNRSSWRNSIFVRCRYSVRWARWSRNKNSDRSS